MIYCVTMKSGTHRLLDLPEELMPQIVARFLKIPGKDRDGKPLPDDFGWLVVEPDTAINLNEVTAIQRHYPAEWFAYESGKDLVWDDDPVESGELAREAFFYAHVAVQAMRVHGPDVVKVAEAIAKASLEPVAGLPGDDVDDDD